MRFKKFSRTIYSFVLAIFFAFFFWLFEKTPEVRLPESNHPIEIYSNQTQVDLRQTIATAISSAKKSVLLLIYTLTDKEIISSLKHKRSEQVPVKVIVDGQASPYADQKLGPDIQTIKRIGKGIMHQKILLVDNSKIWIGSANMTGESLQMHGNLIIGLESQALGEMIRTKADGFPQEGKGPSLLHRDFLIGNQHLEMWFLPDDKEAVNRIKQLIRSAQKTIKIAMFTWTRLDFAQEIANVVLRGVKVQAVIDNHSGQGTSIKVVRKLKKNGIAVRLSSGSGLLHHKLMIIDDHLLITGSANWTKAAFNVNDDCFIVLHDLTTLQKKALEDLWNVIWKESNSP